MAALTEVFAERLLAVAATDASDADHAAILLTDFLACATAGSSRRSWYADLVAIDTSDPAAVADAAAAAHVHDRDDVHWATLVHCGSIIWPVVLGTGAATRASGPELLTAARIGYEAMVRLATFLGPDHRARFHPTATTGTVGAAAAAAFLYGLDGQAFTAALGHAVSVMGGSAQTVRERRGTRLFHRAHAARSGLAAAEAAARGLVATVAGLEQLSDRPADALIGGAESALAQASVRLFPVSGWNQAVYDAAAGAGPFTGPIRQVCVDVAPAVAGVSTGPDAEAADRDWSVEWSVARALVGPEAAGELAGRVVVSRTRSSPLEAVVEVVTPGGRSVGQVHVPQGHPSRPASRAQLHEKWRRQTVVPPEQLYSECRALLAASRPDGARALAELCTSKPPLES
ncbi:MAG TPA: MmgE/PrpD family protein [Mycobacteriales bacterium]|nr:MmgE/PrpD family protein [Mycobacteriales bacterium]